VATRWSYETDGIGPLPHHRLDETLGLSVRLRASWTGTSSATAHFLQPGHGGVVPHLRHGLSSTAALDSPGRRHAREYRRVDGDPSAARLPHSRGGLRRRGAQNRALARSGCDSSRRGDAWYGWIRGCFNLENRQSHGDYTDHLSDGEGDANQ